MEEALMERLFGLQGKRTAQVHPLLLMDFPQQLT
jgi:hypothetical protein